MLTAEACLTLVLTAEACLNTSEMTEAHALALFALNALERLMRYQTTRV